MDLRGMRNFLSAPWRLQRSKKVRVKKCWISVSCQSKILMRESMIVRAALNSCFFHKQPVGDCITQCFRSSFAISNLHTAVESLNRLDPDPYTQYQFAAAQEFKKFICAIDHGG